VSLYYQDDLVTLYHGDCLTETAWLAADVLVTDPPYGMSYQSNSSIYRGPTKAIAGDDTPEIRDSALKIWGAQKPALVFGTWRVERPLGVRQLLIWDKGDSPGMGDLKIPWGPSHEDVYVIGGGFIGKRGGSVIRANPYSPGSNARPDHPTPKPIGLMELLINKTEGLIADPFAGSGATLLAARNLGRACVGVELDEGYCELIAKRLSQQSFDFSQPERAHPAKVELRSSGWSGAEQTFDFGAIA